MTTDSNPKPLGLKWRSNTIFILATVSIGMFTDLFLYGLVVPILPFILTERLDIPQQDVQWWTSLLLALFAGSSVIFSLPAGIIADKLPARQLPFLFGLAALMASTILLWLGRTIEMLVLARILQGISAAVVWTVGFALVMDTVNIDQLGVVIGSIFSIISVGELMAPVLGGIVYKKAGSGATFGMGFGLIVVDLSMRLVMVEKKIAKEYGVVDEETEARDQDEDDESAEDTPLLPSGKKEDSDQWIIPDGANVTRKLPILRCMMHPRWLVAELVCFMQAMLLAVFDATIPTEAQSLFGFDSLQAGLLFIPLALPYLILGGYFGRGVDKYGPKYFAAFGFLYLIIPLNLLRIPQEGGIPEIAKLSLFLALCSFGLSMVSSPGLLEASYIVEQYHKHNKNLFGKTGPYGQLYAVNNMVFSSGLTLGPLIAGTLKDKIGYRNMNSVVSGMCFFVGVLSWVYLGGKPRMLKG